MQKRPVVYPELSTGWDIFNNKFLWIVWIEAKNNTDASGLSPPFKFLITHHFKYKCKLLKIIRFG